MKPTVLLPLLLLSLPIALDAEEPGHPTPPAERALPDGTLYALESTWTDQSGARVAWSKGAGKARVVAMGYTTCQGICPRLIADMQRIEAKLNPDERKAVTFTFLSLAPQSDGVPELKQLVENHKLTADLWQVMTGDADHVLEIAVALGIQYTLLPNKVDYAHSYLIAVLDPDGKVIQKWTDPSEGPEASLKALRPHLSEDE